MSSHDNQIVVLELRLHNSLVGYLAGFNNGRNVLSIADEFRLNPNRPTFSLVTHPKFQQADKIMAEPWVRHQRLHPVLSNLLPEGALRELIAQGLKTHIDNEFQLLTYLAEDLPGALRATPMSPQEVPEFLLGSHDKARVISFNKNQTKRFSLAGVQMKFSMKAKDGRYSLASDALGDWVVKTPSTRHKFVPLNEYTAMSLAQLAGIDIPEIKLVALDALDNLPPINLANEKQAFAIKRFDRDNGQRIHMEDFAQVLLKYPHEKYNGANYQMIAKVIYEFSGNGLADAQQLARRLLVNILLANGDAHLKNWSLLYADKLTPRLAPAYDILTTNVYIENETKLALNLGKTKNWYQLAFADFQYWAHKAAIPWRAIKPHLEDTLDKARTLWPKALQQLPMADEHKQALTAHWQRLDPDFRIKLHP